MIVSPKPPFRKHPRRILWIAISATGIAAVLLYFHFSSLISPSSQFAIVIDAGSSGTRIHVFGYTREVGSLPSLDVKRTAVMRVSPGLSSYTEEPDRAGESLLDLLEFAKGKVEKKQWKNTEIRLMATAGLRMVDGGVEKSILESCKRVLRSSGFRFQDNWATVIPGSNEGIYAWVAANYAIGTLGGDPQKTIGIIELGGASAQITFVSDELLPPESSHVLKFGGTTYKLYSHSFLHFGQNMAQELLHKLLRTRSTKTLAESAQHGIFEDPCSPKGYSLNTELLVPNSSVSKLNQEYQPVVHAHGNFSNCRSASLMLLHKGKENCLDKRCHLGSAFVPELRGRFLATENFFFTSKFFGLNRTSSLSNLLLAGEQFCKEDWSKLKKRYHKMEDADLSRYCFSSAYIVALLHDSLGIPLTDQSRIEFANKVGGIQIEWAVGAFIMQRMIESSQNFYSITAVFHDNLALLLLLVSALVVFLSSCLVSRWRRPQLKTIYDLEKGCYIISHVG
ncbi:probable apyrase 6 isoform X1 [Typha latifolia]|uniref:probable apyrase 6 isoform X1 n=1 Tax=Typha latifolia TaxID=4733 RepID=UPI003C2DC757